MQRSKRGFTLIELLVVIAIIAILAAIIFPVYARVKLAGYKSSDTSNLNAIRNALQLYRADQGGYPPALLGYATLYAPGNTANVVPASGLHSFLYSRRIDSVETFRPALDRPKNTDITTAVWPTADSRAVGATPILDLNGDGVINGSDDDPNARQAYGPNTQVTRSWGGRYNAYEDVSGSGNVATPVPAYFYNISGYDVATVPAGSNAFCTAGNKSGCVELRYAPFWTKYALQGQGGVFGSITDDPRQLGYNEPPENTVITWDSYFRELANGAIQHQRTDVILFLGGSARPYDSRDLADRSWRAMP